jgi:hypothetical protein
MRAFISISLLIFLTINSFSQELNFDEIGLCKYDNIKEIKHFEVLHTSESKDTKLVNNYFYNIDGSLIEKRCNYRTTQKRRKRLGDTGNQYLYTDTVGTKENPAFTTIKYKYNKKGNLINKFYQNTEPIFPMNGLYTKNPMISECKNFNSEGLHTSSEITYKRGNIEIHHYTYNKKLISSIYVYRNEKLYKSVFFKYIYYTSKK